MRPAGNYNKPVRRLICTRVQESTYAQYVPTYTAGAILWGERKLNRADEVNDLGRIASRVYGTFRFRNQPELSGDDHLLDLQTNIEYKITGLITEDTETIVDVEKYKDA